MRAPLAALGATLLACAAAPGAQAAGDCFWVGPYASTGADRDNQAFPDSGAQYWTARLTLPPGASLRLEGRYPHARYASLNAYDAGTAAPVDALTDHEIAPDAGSANPFRFTATTLPLSVYLPLRDQPGRPPTFPARKPPVFGTFYNVPYTLDCVYRDLCPPHAQRVGGQYTNADNDYVGAFVSRGFGEVLVLRGKLPRTPGTLSGERRMRPAQLRYWSLCQNESLATTAGAGCVHDEQVPIDRRRRYVVVTSLPRDRPANARRRCGVAFVPWPARGDGAGHPDDGLILVRNMLPAPDFAHAIQGTRAPGDEAEVMGLYLPRGQYTTTREFERDGC